MKIDGLGVFTLFRIMRTVEFRTVEKQDGGEIRTVGLHERPPSPDGGLFAFYGFFSQPLQAMVRRNTAPEQCQSI